MKRINRSGLCSLLEETSMPTLENVNAAHAALRNWVLNLHRDHAERVFTG
jgi:hypothetical protein